MRHNQLGHLYRDGELLVRRGDRGNSMFLIQKGHLEIILDESGDTPIATRSEGEFLGEMSLFTGEPRSATVRSRGESRVLTIDEPAFRLRIKEDPVLAYRILEKLHERMQSLHSQGAGWLNQQRQTEPTAPSRGRRRGKKYLDGQVVLAQGFVGQAMGVVEKGRVTVFHKSPDGEESIYRILGPTETFGVSSLFDAKPRHTGIRASGTAWAAVMDRRDFIRRIHDDPQLAFGILRSLCLRISEMGNALQGKTAADLPTESGGPETSRTATGS